MNQETYKQMRQHFPSVDHSSIRNILSQQKDQNLLIQLIYMLRRFREIIERVEDLTKFGLSLWEKLDIQIPKELHEELQLSLVETKFYYQALLANKNSNFLSKNKIEQQVSQLSEINKCVNDNILLNYQSQRPYQLPTDEAQEQQTKKLAQTPKMPQENKGFKTFSINLNISDPNSIEKLIRNNKYFLQLLGIKWDYPKNTNATQTDQIEGLPQLSNKNNKNQKKDQNKEMKYYEYQQEIGQCTQYLPTYDTVEQLTKDIKNFVLEIEQYNIKNKNAFQKLIDEISNVVQQTYPDAIVDVYGSHATELCLPHSDIDLVIKISNQQEKFVTDILYRLETELKKCKFIEETKCVTQSTTPVLRAKCNKQYQNKRLDISIQETKHNGIQCVQLIRKYIKNYEPLKPLTLIMKQFLHKCDLSDTYSGGLSSYGLILMMVSFLQSYSNQEKAWPTLGTLLIEFLNVYGCELDYAGKTICPDQPESFEQEATIIFDPHNFAYCQQQSLVIIDPLNSQNNVGRPSYNVAKIKLAFILAFSKLLTFDSSQNQSPLKYFFNSAQNIQCSLHSVLINQYQAYADQIMFGTSTRY